MVEDAPVKRGRGRPAKRPPGRVNTVRNVYRFTQAVRDELRARGISEKEIPGCLPVWYVACDSEKAAEAEAEQISLSVDYLATREFRAKSRPEAVRMLQIGNSKPREASDIAETAERAAAAGIAVTESWAAKFTVDQKSGSGFGSQREAARQAGRLSGATRRARAAEKAVVGAGDPGDATDGG